LGNKREKYVTWSDKKIKKELLEKSKDGIVPPSGRKGLRKLVLQCIKRYGSWKIACNKHGLKTRRQVQQEKSVERKGKAYEEIEKYAKIHYSEINLSKKRRMTTVQREEFKHFIADVIADGVKSGAIKKEGIKVRSGLIGAIT